MLKDRKFKWRINNWSSSKGNIPSIVIFERKSEGILVENFKGHSIDGVKEYTTSLKSGDETDTKGKKDNLVAFEIMAGGITPKSLSVGAITEKVFNGYYQ